jgi:hypothetical protein
VRFSTFCRRNEKAKPVILAGNAHVLEEYIIEKMCDIRIFPRADSSPAKMKNIATEKKFVVGRIRTCAGKAHMISSHAR